MPGRKVVPMVDIERLKKIVDQLYRYNYWFCNEMMKEEENLKTFDRACEEAKRTGENVMLITGAPGNVKCMKGCMEDTVKVISFLRNKEEQEYIEPWQLAGAEAILNTCREENAVPFDLPATLMAVFGMWKELEDGFKGE